MDSLCKRKVADPFQIDLLFASNTLWVWDTEKRFQELKLEHSDLVHGVDHHSGGKVNGAIDLVEDVSKENTVQESL
jgi:hypothetical protein